jgi:hypothetical protein
MTIVVDVLIIGGLLAIGAAIGMWDRRMSRRELDASLWMDDDGRDRSSEYTGPCPQCGGSTYGYHCSTCTPKGV